MADKHLIVADEDLPALYIAANSASVSAQKRHTLLFAASLLFLVLGAVISMISFSSPDYRSLAAVLSGTSFVISLLLTATIKIKGYDRDWYGARAIAEAVKTLAWRYMTHADPYRAGLKSKDVDEEFASDLASVLSQQKHPPGVLDGDFGGRPQITERMREMRGLGTQDRRDYYLSGRIEDQRRWYSIKAKTSRSREGRWFAAIIVAQIAAVASAFFIVRSPSLPIFFTGIFANLAAAFMAWSQMKRDNELAQSYNLAAQELGIIAIKARHVDTDDDLSALVIDAEKVLSREHTLWVARREQA